MKKMQCECSDPGCPEHEGRSECTKQAKHMVRRIDFADQPKCYLCHGCYKDALDSGVFA